jgi:hypothetical protein
MSEGFVYLFGLNSKLYLEPSRFKMPKKGQQAALLDHLSR